MPDAPLVLACGDSLEARPELSRREENIDHVWISMDCGIGPRITVSVNTRSLHNARAGADSRVRIGRVRGTAKHLPPRGAKILPSFDYGAFEAANNIFYEHMERRVAEAFLLEICRRSIRMEAWGAPYRRGEVEGLHQVHSRRASCAVPRDLQGLDGGLKFFREAEGEYEWTVVLTKFCGQT